MTIRKTFASPCWPRGRAGGRRRRARAQLKVGIVVSATGPAASLGIPQKNTAALLPKEMAGQKVEYIVLDDASDTTTAVRNIKKLIDEEHVDVVIGPSTTPNAIAMTDSAAESETPVISMAAAAALITPMDAKQALDLQDAAERFADGRRRRRPHGATKVARSRSSRCPTATGRTGSTRCTKLIGDKNIRIVATERTSRPMRASPARCCASMAAKPDAVLIASRGHAGRVAGEGVEGARLQGHDLPDARRREQRLPARRRQGRRRQHRAGRPVLVALQLPDSNASKKLALEYTKLYESAYGARQRRDVRRASVGRGAVAAGRAARRAREDEAGHEGIPHRVARQHREREEPARSRRA